MEIRKMLVDENKYSLKCPYSMKPEFIIVHNTANDASANNEISYMRTNSSSTSFHIAVDDKEAVQGIPFDRNSWNAGDGSSGKGNRYGIAIEICYSKSGGDKWEKAKTNAIELIAQLLKERNWGTDKIKKHQDFNGKYCPHRILDEGWDNFINRIKEKLGEEISKPATPSKPNTNKIDEDGKWGTETTKKAQKVFGTTVDGIVTDQYATYKSQNPGLIAFEWKDKPSDYGSELIREIQKKVGATVDGHIGPETIKKMQKWLGTIQDGYVSNPSDVVKAFQKWLNKQ